MSLPTTCQGRSFAACVVDLIIDCALDGMMCYGVNLLVAQAAGLAATVSAGSPASPLAGITVAFISGTGLDDNYTASSSSHK